MQRNHRDPFTTYFCDQTVCCAQAIRWEAGTTTNCEVFITVIPTYTIEHIDCTWDPMLICRNKVNIFRQAGQNRVINLFQNLRSLSFIVLIALMSRFRGHLSCLKVLQFVIVGLCDDRSIVFITGLVLFPLGLSGHLNQWFPICIEQLCE